MPELEIALLGPPKIILSGEQVKTDRRKAIALLAYLAVTGKPQPRDFLAALLWPDYAQNSAYAYLRRTLWELNQILTTGWIAADREQVHLAVDEGLWVDTVRFENLIDPAHSEIGTVQLEEAFSLYRDDFMTGFSVADTAPFEEWQTRQVEFYRRKFAQVLENLIELHTSAGEFEIAHTYARDWLALDTLNESAHCAIMRLLAEMGDRTGAIRQYEACVQILKSELGVPPQPETDDLYDLILHGEISGARKTSEITKLNTLHPTSRVPGMPTPFIGRNSEVKQLLSLITNPAHRLVTLIGPGGMGKTRLSIQVATEVGETFSDGVFFVPLAAAKTSDDVLQAIAQSLDFAFYKEEERPRHQLINYLREKQLLLILDNFEHLLGASDLVMEMLLNAPEVKLIATSRIRLNMQGEQLFVVTGMQIPDLAEAESWDNPEEQSMPFSAIQLFLDRARRVQPEFVLVKDSFHSVIEICHLVQGMPLGIELAAAWLELLPLDEITAEIARSLDFLETDQSDVPDRQRSLRAVFESSWKLLSESERNTFLQLCVFVGSFSRAAAQKVSGATLKNLLALVKKSWLQQIDGGRFQLHELMRQYGEERLKADEKAWRTMNTQHAEYYAEFVAEQSALMKSAGQVEGLRALALEYGGNVKTAWDWLVSEQRWKILIEKMLLGMFQFGIIRYQLDIPIPWLRAARQFLEGDQTQDGRLALVVFGTFEVFCEETHQIKDDDPIGRASRIWGIVCQYELAQPMGFWFVLLAGIVRARNLTPEVDEKQLENVIAVLGKNPAKWQLGMARLFEGNWWRDYDFDGDKLAEAANAFKQAGTPYEQGMVEEMLAVHAFQKHAPFDVVLAHYDRARVFFQQMEGMTRSGINMTHLWDVYLQMGEPQKAFAIFRDERPELERRGNLVHLSANLHWEALHAVRYSTFEHALQMREQSLIISRRLGHQSEIAWRLLELGEIYRIFGQPKKALEMYEQARPRFEKMHITLALGFDQRARGDLALQDGRYTDALSFYQRYLEYAQEDNHQWSIAQAQAKIALAQAYLHNIQEARHGVQKVLRRIQGWHQDDLALQTILAEPICLIHEDKLEAAAELANFINNHHMSWNETKQHASVILEMASRNLTEKSLQAAIKRSQARDLETTIADLIN